MTSAPRLVTVGRVGRAHGRDGSFWVEETLGKGRDGSDPLEVGAEVFVGDRCGRVERRAGTEARPLLRLDAVEDRESVAALRGEALRVAEAAAPLAADEWLIEDLVGASVEGVGEVRRVLAAPSCDLLEVGDEGLLIPLVSDAVRRVDVEAGRIEVDHAFLGMDQAGAGDEVGGVAEAESPGGRTNETGRAAASSAPRRP